MEVRGLRHSYPRVLASLEFGSNEYVFEGSTPFVRNGRQFLKYFAKEQLLLLPFLHEYLLVVRHRRTVLRNEGQDSLILCQGTLSQ